MDRSKAFEVENGFLIDGGPFFTGGTASPIGSVSAQAGDFYIQTTGTKPVIFFCTGTGVNDWRLARTDDFVNVRSVHNHTTTLNGSDTLTASDDTIHILDGTATGYSVVLPDATTLTNGRRFEVVNNSDETVLLKDDGLNTIGTLISGDVAVITLESNVTSNGSWLVVVTSSQATGVQAFNTTSSTLFTTTSSSFVAVPGMSFTPVTGTYAIWYSSDIEVIKNNAIATIEIFKAGVGVTNSTREVQAPTSNFSGLMQTLSIIQVNGAETLDVRAKISTDSLEITQRSFLGIRLGA